MAKTLASGLVCLLSLSAVLLTAAGQEKSATTQPAAASAPASAPAPQTSTAATEPAPPTQPAEPPATKPAEPPKPAPLKLEAFVHGKTVTATVDQDIVLELKGAVATPWEVTKVEGPSVQQVGKVEFKPKTEGAADGTYTATFKAVKEGKTTIQLQALIEAGKKEKMEIKFTVSVSAAGA